MKNLIILLTLLAGFSLSEAGAQTAVNVSNSGVTIVKPNAPVAKFDKITMDFGDIEKGIPKTADFILTNDGKEPLIIASAVASCGCTNLKYDKEPVLPGKTSTISATYNAATPGPFTKTITIKTNASEQAVILTIKGKVVEKKN